MRDFYGNKKAIEKINLVLESGKTPHAIILSGPKGIGKFLLSQKITEKLFGAKVDFNSELIQDLLILSPGEKREIGINEIRKIPDFIYLSPAKYKSRVVIIDDADLLNENAANALLKILEEPPKNSYLLLVCHNEQALKKTIKSRSSIIRMSPLSDEEILEFAKSKLIDENLIPLCANSLGALEFLHFNDALNCLRELEFLIEGFSFEKFEIFYSSFSKSENFWQIFIILMSYVIRNLVLKGLNPENYNKFIELTGNTEIYNLDKKQVSFSILNLIAEQLQENIALK